MNKLAYLCDNYGSDKGSLDYSGTHAYPWNPHTYTTYYEMLFCNRIETTKCIFECGLGTNNESYKSNMTKTGKPGASLRVWRDYFVNAEVIGCDIDDGVLFTEDRITTYQLDQTDTIQAVELFKSLDKKFDIFIDDGLHEAHAGFTLYQTAKHFMQTDSIYVIEDVKQHDLTIYRQLFNQAEVIIDVIELGRPNEQVFDNTLIVIKNKETA